MAKHTGHPKRDLDAAVESAAQQALEQSGPGTYVLDNLEVNVVHDPHAAPGNNPIRDYIVTLAGA